MLRQNPPRKSKCRDENKTFCYDSVTGFPVEWAGKEGFSEGDLSSKNLRDVPSDAGQLRVQREGLARTKPQPETHGQGATLPRGWPNRTGARGSTGS